MDTVYLTKVCTRCGMDKPVTSFEKKSAWCHRCRQERKAERHAEQLDTVRTCTICGVEQPMANFEPARTQCRECRKAFKRANHFKSHESNLAKKRAYDAAHVEERRVYDAARWKAYGASINRFHQRWLDAHRPQIRAISREYYSRNTHRWKVINNMRRARKKTTQVEPVVYATILLEHGRICHICGLPIGDDLHFDHVIPLSKGGPHIAANIRPAHALCNLRKKDKLL